MRWQLFSVTVAALVAWNGVSQTCALVIGDKTTGPVPVTLEWEDLTYTVLPKHKKELKVILNSVSRQLVRS